MKLITPDKNHYSAEPVMPVRWCLEPGEGTELKDRRARNINILFVIRYENCQLEDRFLVSIDELMTYLPFRRPGKHTVFAAIVYADDAVKLRLGIFRGLNYGTFYSRVLAYELSGIEIDHNLRDLGVCTIGGAVKLDNVVIDAAHFPKDPPAWLAKLINFQFEATPRDQCHFRRRVLAAPIRLPWFGLWAVITTLIRANIALALALCTVRNIGFAAIIHPWNSDIVDVGGATEFDDSWIACDGKGKRRSRWFYLLHPFIYAALFAGVTALKFQHHLTYWAAFVLLATLVWKFLVLIRPIIVGGIVGASIGRLIVALAMRRKMAASAIVTPSLEENKLQREDLRYDDLTRVLACQTMPFEVRMDAIPAERRTIHLRFLDLKRKVCRPYAVK